MFVGAENSIEDFFSVGDKEESIKAIFDWRVSMGLQSERCVILSSFDDILCSSETTEKIKTMYNEALAGNIATQELQNKVSFLNSVINWL